MAVVEQPQTNTTPRAEVASLNQYVKGESLWQDAWKRLRRNKPAILGLAVILAWIIIAIMASSLAPKPFDIQVLADNNAAPRWVIDLFPQMIAKDDGGYVTVSTNYPLGADNLGRDLLSRVIYGARVSLAVAFIGPMTALIVGLGVGLLAGYVGGRVDNALMRIVDLMYAFPTLLFVILLMTFFRTSFSNPPPGSLAAALGSLDAGSGGMLFIFIGIGLTSWMGMARLARGQVLSVREKEYIEAARALGGKNRRIVWSHVLPNILGPIIVSETLTIPSYISTEAFLSFIGLGVNPPTPSWGMMIAEGSRSIGSYPHQALFPALALFSVMFAFNFLGDGLRDALDPRMRGVD
ncbi:MAG: ABC transporter permease [Anaerolineae bacterium]|nr:ABC transporter permease [Anaerolineae bacterium]